MNHPFSPDASKDRNKCSICSFDWLSHTAAARCSKCNNQSKCNVVDGNTLLCENKCFIEHELEMKKDLKESSDIINPIIAKARDIDSKMKYSGYFFNSETVSHKDIKIAIDNDDNIPAEDKKNRFFMELVKRFTTYQEEIVKIDDKKAELVEQQLAISNTLRTYGNEVREEYRNKLRVSDSLYSPLVISKVANKSNVKKVTTDPFTRMAEQVALKRNISIDEAKRQLIDNGMKPS